MPVQQHFEAAVHVAAALPAVRPEPGQNLEFDKVLVLLHGDLSADCLREWPRSKAEGLDLHRRVVPQGACWSDCKSAPCNQFSIETAPRGLKLPGKDKSAVVAIRNKAALHEMQVFDGFYKALWLCRLTAQRRQQPCDPYA